MKTSILFSFSILLWVIAVNLSTAQRQSHFVQPTLFDFFIGSQIIEDSVVRLVGRASDAPNPFEGAVFYTDYKLNDILEDPGFHWIRFDSAELNGAVSNLYFFPHTNGHSLFVLERLDCDFTLAPALFRMDGNGNILWIKTFEFDSGERIVLESKRVGENAISIRVKDETLYFDFDGNLLLPDDELIQFEDVFEINGDYITSGGDQDFLLDQEGQIARDWPLATQFRSGSMAFGDKFLFATQDSLYLYDATLQLLLTEEIDHRADRIIGAPTFAFIFDIFTNHLYTYDANLNLIEDQTIMQEVAVAGGASANGLVFLWGFFHQFYFPGTARGVFIHQDREDDFNLDFAYDIGIDSIDTQDSIHYRKSEFGLDGDGIDVVFDSLRVKITNEGFYTVSKFNINFFASSDCSNCTFTHQMWTIDSVQLQPSQSKWIDLGALHLTCAEVNASEICMWVAQPNNAPDTQPLNDYLCQGINLVSLDDEVPKEYKLLNPTGFDDYVSHQVLPDGTIRFFWHGNNPLIGNLFYMDLKDEVSLEQVDQVLVEVPESEYWNWYSFGHFTMSMADGSTWLMNRAHQCDLIATGAIVKLNLDSTIDWFTEVGDTLYINPEKMLFMDPSRIGFLSLDANEETLILDTAGNVLAYEETQFPYEEIIQTSTGFIAATDDELYILDIDFSEKENYSLNANILAIWPQENDYFIIKTQGAFYEVDALGQLKLLPFDDYDFDVVWRSENHYWGSEPSAGRVVKMNEQFVLIGTPFLPPGIVPIFGASVNEDIYVVGQYFNDVNRGLIVYKSGAENVWFGLKYDLEVTNIRIPDSVRVDYVSGEIFGSGWYHFYDYVDVEVRNNGTDTVHSFYIQDPNAEECFMCEIGFNTWKIDSVSLAPGESVTISLGIFNPVCQYHDPGSLCLYATGPNDEADYNINNDALCQPYSLLIPTHEPEASLAFDIIPNPASDEIYFKIDPAFDGEIFCTVYNATGSITDQFMVDEYSHSIESYSAGIYIFIISNGNGAFGYQRVLKFNE